MIKFSCQRQSLQDIISKTARVVSSNTNIPILKGLLLEIADSQLRITGTDTDITIQSSIDVVSEAKGNIVIDARMLSDIVRNLPEDEVTINIDDNFNTEIKCQNAKFKIKGFNSEEFPKPLIINQTESILIEQKLFKDMIRQTSFAASNDELKPVLTGVLFEIEDSLLTMVAVDGYRLALKKCIIHNNGVAKNIIVPAKTLNEVSKILEDDKDVKIFLSNNCILFDLGDSVIYSRVIDGEFLKYKQIIQTEFSTTSSVKTKVIQSSIERASLIINSKENKSIPVKFNVFDDKIVITAASEIGEVYDELISSNNGKDIEIGFNPKYLIDVFKIIEDEDIIIKFGSSISPCTINPVNGEEFLYLILPIKLKNT